MKDKNNSLLTVYVATSRHYFKFARGFIDTLPLFLPEFSKYIHFFTDQMKSAVELNREDTKKEERVLSKFSLSFIEHKPWPMTPLMKFMYIQRAIESLEEPDCNYVLYSDSQIEFVDTITAEEVIREGKITTVPHILAPDYPTPFKIHQYWVQNQNTNAQIDWDYTYVNSGFILGEKDMMLDLCKTINGWMLHDLANNRIPAVQDESYFNRWCFENKDKVYILPRGEYWSMRSEPECPSKKGKINIRDYSDIEMYKHNVREGL